MTRPLTIIGLTGKARAGKNTVADMITDLLDPDGASDTTVQLAFAGPLKASLLALDPIVGTETSTPDDTDRMRETTITPVSLGQVVEYHGWEHAKDHYPEVRGLLQRLGTEAGRDIHGEHLWLDAMTQQITQAREKNPALTTVIITDARFANEISYVASAVTEPALAPVARSMVLHVVRPSQTASAAHMTARTAGHASETGVDAANPAITATVRNDSDLNNLWGRVEAVLVAQGLPTAQDPVVEDV